MKWPKWLVGAAAGAAVASAGISITAPQPHPSTATPTIQVPTNAPREDVLDTSLEKALQMVDSAADCLNPSKAYAAPIKAGSIRYAVKFVKQYEKLAHEKGQRINYDRTVTLVNDVRGLLLLISQPENVSAADFQETDLHSSAAELQALIPKLEDIQKIPAPTS